jgi:hypothetical protein
MTADRSKGAPFHASVYGQLKARMLAAVILSVIQHPSGGATNAMYRVSDNGHYLLGPSGEPFFWQGDTEWELFYLLTVQDAKDLLQARKAQGFTVIQAMCDGMFPKWGPADKRPPLDQLMPWLDDNPLTPNEAFFRRMDAVVAAAQKNHQLLLIGVYHADDVSAKRITSANVGGWTRWLANRYKNAPNIIWSMYSAPEASSIPMVQAAVKGLKEGDGGSHLITLHPEGAAGSSSFVQGGLSLNTFQSLSGGHLNYELAQADYTRTPPKPVINGEALYEGDKGTTSFDVRRSAWWSYLAGAAFSYGHIKNWSSPASWREWINAPGAGQIQATGRLLRSLAWWKLLPDQSILIEGGEAAAARSVDGDWILVYLPTNRSVTLKLDSVTSSKTVLVSWINPLDGEKLRVGVYSTATRPSLTPPPGWQDAVLLAERMASSG